MPETNESITVLGFDLGHGESSVAFLHDAFSNRGKDGSHPQDLFKSQPTILATLRDDGGMVWGYDAVRHSQIAQDQLSAFEICFKARPGVPNSDSTVERFARTILGAARNKLTARPGDRLAWFIGCPSAWNEEAQKSYCQLFRQAGFEKVSVVAESRAAFSYYYEMTDSTVADLKRPTIVLDFGSSTLDATLAIGLYDKELDPGIPLGASWIDKAILEWNLRHCSEDDFPAGRQDGAKIARQINSNRITRNRVELMVREAKESFCNSAPGTYSDHDHHLERRIDAGDLRFRIAIHERMMDELLNTRLESVVPELTTDSVPDYIKEELVGHSWLGRCSAFLEKIAGDLPRYNASLSGGGQVLLTGGASRMREVRDLVTSFFGKEANVRIVLDQEPEMCIARGLACWGRTALQTEAFEAKARDLLLNESQLLTLIEAQCKAAGLHSVINERWAEEALRWLRSWRAGNTKAHDIGGLIAYVLRKWAESGELDKAVRKCVSQAERGIRTAINDKIRPLLAEYRIAEGVTFLGETPMFDRVIDCCRKDCSNIVAIMENLSLDNLGDDWFSRKFFKSENDLRELVDSQRRDWNDIDTKALYDSEHNKRVFADTIQGPLKDDINNAIRATRYLLSS